MGYRRIASHGCELVFAWTEAADGRSQVQTAVARVTVTTAASCSRSMTPWRA